MPTLSTNKARYEELMKNPLLFLHRDEHSYTDENGNDVVRYAWKAVDIDFSSSIDDGEFQGNCYGYNLVVSEAITKEKSLNQEIVSFDIHEVNASDIDDWRIVINSYIIRSQAPADRYPYIHLLWMLDNCQWNSEIIVKALGLYDVMTQPYIINALSKICRCLSVDKQQLMKNALMRFNYNYEIYLPDSIIEARSFEAPETNEEYKNWNLFELTDFILGNDVVEFTGESIDDQTQNPFLRFLRWLHNDDASVDYSTLNSIYALSSHKIQMEIVKRYFHDVRLGKTVLDAEILEQFKESKYSEFIRYRYCLYSPDEPINLSVPLLNDILLTVLHSNGETFQTFDGVLDFVITHCDVTKPSITLGMEEFLPQCDGGAVYNRQFYGFIDYDIVFELDESKFTEENLLGTIRTWLDAKSRHQTYYACGYDEEKRPLSGELLERCLSSRIIEEKTPEGVVRRKAKLTCLKECQYQNKWVVYDSDYKWLNHILKEPMPEVNDNHYPNNTHIIDLEQTSIEKMSNYIRSRVGVCRKIDEKRFIISSGALKTLRLLVQYSKPLTMRIIPQSKPVVGWKFDVFGIKKAICEEKNIHPFNASDVVKQDFKDKESMELKKRVVETLKIELKANEFDGKHFEVPYNKELLLRLKNLYYFNKSIPHDPKDWQIQFLTSQNNKNHKPYCAPKLSEERDKATGLPYFWCRGLECFHNCLEQQTLENCSSWQHYSLYHLIEIMGFPKLRKTEAGYEPDETITDFIACANRAMKKFRRLKCRNCGHLMYTHKGSGGINLHNYYSCINPTCPEYNQPVYLSYCFKCKTGLIDSRDSAKCPNGWYICPSCLSCCDDDLYDRQAQRYTLQNKPVPIRVLSKLGQGHNDKGIYYCHKCGTQLQYYVEDDKERWICPTCSIEYDNGFFKQPESTIV